MTENRAFFAVGSLMVLLSLVCATGSRLRGPPPPLPPNLTTVTPVAPVPRPSGLDLRPEPEPDPRAGYVTEALQALGEASGQGVIGCAVPESLDQDALIWGASAQERTGSVIRATVPEATGAAPIGVTADHPVGVAVWREAWPGEAGVCSVEPLRRLEHRVTLEGARGGVILSGTCDEALLDEATVVVRHPAWLPCTVVAKGAGLRGELRIATEEPTNDLVLALAPDDGTAEEPGPPRTEPPTAAEYDDALASPGLSPGARVLLKLWKPSGNPAEPAIPE